MNIQEDFERWYQAAFKYPIDFTKEADGGYLDFDVFGGFEAYKAGYGLAYDLAEIRKPTLWLTQKEFDVLSKQEKTDRETVPLYLSPPINDIKPLRVYDLLISKGMDPSKADFNEILEVLERKDSKS
jgi:hypothetical protein